VASSRLRVNSKKLKLEKISKKSKKSKNLVRVLKKNPNAIEFSKENNELN